MLETINNAITAIKPLVELLSFIATVAVAIVAVIGLQQITLLKNVSSMQARRDALRLTSEQCTLYFDKTSPLQDSVDRKIREKGIKYFEGWTLEVTTEAITLNRKTPVPREKVFFEILTDLLAVLNSMEAFAVYFTSRVADEQIAFNTVGKTFVNSCERLMPWILDCREEGHYINVVELYGLWKDRIQTAELRAQRKSIDEKLATSRTRFHTPIGS